MRTHASFALRRRDPQDPIGLSARAVACVSLVACLPWFAVLSAVVCVCWRRAAYGRSKLAILVPCYRHRESGFADRGIAKPLVYAANVGRFARFRHKILHVVQDDATYLSNARRRKAATQEKTNPGVDWTNAVEDNRMDIIRKYYDSRGGNAWCTSAAQSNASHAMGACDVKNTLFLVGDVDELAAAEVLAEIKYCLPRDGHRHTRRWWPPAQPRKDTPRRSIVPPLRVPLIPYTFDLEHVAPWNGEQRLQSPHHVAVLDVPARQAMRYSNYPFYAGSIPPRHSPLPPNNFSTAPVAAPTTGGEVVSAPPSIGRRLARLFSRRGGGRGDGRVGGRGRGHVRPRGTAFRSPRGRLGWRFECPCPRAASISVAASRRPRFS